jgi:hypothetical protein
VLQVDLGTVMSVYNEPFYSYSEKMVHYAGDNRAPAEWEKRFGTMFCQRPEPQAQSCPENKCGFESSSGHRTFYLTMKHLKPHENRFPIFRALRGRVMIPLYFLFTGSRVYTSLRVIECALANGKRVNP